jgi:hypothetical protein
MKATTDTEARLLLAGLAEQLFDEGNVMGTEALLHAECYLADRLLYTVYPQRSSRLVLRLFAPPPVEPPIDSELGTVERPLSILPLDYRQSEILRSAQDDKPLALDSRLSTSRLTDD